MDMEAHLEYHHHVAMRDKRTAGHHFRAVNTAFHAGTFAGLQRSIARARLQFGGALLGRRKTSRFNATSPPHPTQSNLRDPSTYLGRHPSPSACTPLEGLCHAMPVPLESFLAPVGNASGAARTNPSEQLGREASLTMAAISAGL